MASRPVSVRPLLCGYYGEHNLGDDALLEALLRQLPRGCTPVVTAHDEAEVRRRHGVTTCARRRLVGVMRTLLGCDALVLGGGSLLQDSTSGRSLVYYVLLITLARLSGRPVVLWAQGLGPLRRRCSRGLVAATLPLARAVSWRDPASGSLARRLQHRRGAAEPRIGPDPVWALPGASWRGRGGPIVVCWRQTPRLDTEGWRRLLAELADLACAADRPLLWMPFHRDQDRDLLEGLSQRGLLPPDLARISRPRPVTDHHAAAEVFRHAGLVLAMRLHAMILAAVCGAPVAALSYDPKVAAAAADGAIPCWPVGQATASGQLARRWRQQLDRPADAARRTELARAAAVHRLTLTRGLGYTTAAETE